MHAQLSTDDISIAGETVRVDFFEFLNWFV